MLSNDVLVESLKRPTGSVSRQPSTMHTTRARRPGSVSLRPPYLGERYFAPDIGIATSLIRCVCPLGSGTSPYTM